MFYKIGHRSIVYNYSGLTVPHDLKVVPISGTAIQRNSAKGLVRYLPL